MGWLCDGQSDCPDADDEDGCPTKLQSFFKRMKQHIPIETEKDETTTTIAVTDTTTTTVYTTTTSHVKVPLTRQKCEKIN